MATKLLAEFRTKVEQVLQDLAFRLEPAAKDAAIQEAVREYSKHRPVERVHDFAGDGATYDIPLGTAPGPTDWVEGFSAVRQVEYPAGERQPLYLDQEDWTIYRTPTGRVLRLLVDTPPLGETVRTSYAILHTLTEAVGTIPEADFDAVANLAGAHAAHALAMSFAQQGDPTVSADSVDHKSKAAEYAAAAARLRKFYFSHMGINDEKGAGAASVHQDWDATPGIGGDYLTHPRSTR